jgi:hypothetical protein
LLCFALVGFSVQAQTRLTGRIVDTDDRALPAVLVDFNNGFIRTISDNEGNFSLTYPDTLTNSRIRFQAFGYKTKSMIVGRGQQSMKVVLLDSVYGLSSVTVLAARNGRFSDYSAQTVQMSMFDIVTNPAAMADIIGNMRVLPGVQTDDNDGRLIIQGGSPDESQIYINDLIVANPYSVSMENVGARSRFTPDLFFGTVLQSGGFNAEFGQALSGIVNLNTKEREQMSAKTDIAVSSVYSGLTHIEQKPSYAWRASVDYSNLFLTEKIIPSAYECIKPYQSVRSDIFLTKNFSPDTRMTAQFNGSYANGVYAYANVDSMESENSLTQSYLYAQTNFYHTFDDRFSLSAAANMIVDTRSNTELLHANGNFSAQNIWNHSKITLQYRSHRIVNRTGVEFIFNPLRETYAPSGYDYRQSLQNNLAGVYSDTKIFLSGNLTASAGLRGEYSVRMRKFNVAPRLYMAYRLNGANIFSVATGDYFQLPSPDYLKMADNLDFTSVRKVTASYSYVEKESKLQVDAYYKKYNKAVTYSPEGFAGNSGNGYAYGADVFWKNNIHSLEYWATCSFNRTRKKYDGFTEAVEPPHVARYSANLTLKYYISSLKSMAAASGFISSGRPFYSSDFPRTKLGETPHHSRVDISWSFLPKQWIVVHFGCQNVLGRKNIYGYEYSETTPGVRRAVTAASERFVFLGVFITLSRSKTLNQLKSL